MNALPISPLSMNQLTRDYWGSVDGPAITQIADLANDDCYQPKFYKAPDTTQEQFTALGYLNYGLKITPGSIIYGIFLPSSLVTSQPPQFNVQIEDVSLNRRWFDEPIPSLFLGNYKPTYLSPWGFPAAGQMGSFCHLLDAPYPVVGTGMFSIDFWETSGVAQRIELIFGVLEAMQ